MSLQASHWDKWVLSSLHKAAAARSYIHLANERTEQITSLCFNTSASNLLQWHPSVSLTTYTWNTDQRQDCWAVCATFHHNTSSPVLKHSWIKLQSQSKFQWEDVASRPFAVNDTGRDVKCLCGHCVGEAATLTCPWRWTKGLIQTWCIIQYILFYTACYRFLLWAMSSIFWGCAAELAIPPHWLLQAPGWAHKVNLVTSMVFSPSSRLTSIFQGNAQALIRTTLTPPGSQWVSRLWQQDEMSPSEFTQFTQKAHALPWYTAYPIEAESLCYI